jgi:ABC-type lipoprotein release transport system permease subunit
MDLTPPLATEALPAAEPPAPVGRRRASLGLIGSLSLSALGEHPLSLSLLLLAVGAGVGFQVPNIANVAGYRAELLRQEVGAGLGHVRVRPRSGGRFRDAEPILKRLRAIPGVTAAQPALMLPAALRSGPKFSLTQIVGVEPGAERRTYKVVEGQDLDPRDGSGVVLGTRLAKTLDVGVGDDIDLDVLLSAQPRLILDDHGVGNYTMHVRGLAGLNAFDQSFANRSFLAGELGEDGAASIIFVFASDSASLPLARRIASDAERELPSVTAASWYDDSHYLRSVIGALDALANVTGLMTIVAVGVPVLALLYIDALNRRRQVSLLVAMGFRSADIFWVFLVKAIVIAVLGVALGLVFATGLLGYFSLHPLFSWERFVLTPVVTLKGFLSPALVVLGATVLAGSYPAWRAARVDPSSTLRRIE